jgi:hypothetical protein
MKITINRVGRIPMNHRQLITLTVSRGSWFQRTFFWFIWKQEVKQFIGFGSEWVEVDANKQQIVK